MFCSFPLMVGKYFKSYKNTAYANWGYICMLKIYKRSPVILPGEKQLEEMFQLQGVNSPHLFINSIPSFTWKWSPPLYEDPTAKSIARIVQMTQRRSLCHPVDPLLQHLHGFLIPTSPQGSDCHHMDGWPSVWIPQRCKNNTSLSWVCAQSGRETIFEYISSVGRVRSLLSVCHLLKTWTAKVLVGWPPTPHI